MTQFFAALETYARFWPYAAAGVCGILAAVVDWKTLGRPILAGLLLLVVAGGFAGMNLSPFTFAGGDYYFQSLIAMLLAIAALVGYAVAALAMKFRGGKAQ